MLSEICRSCPGKYGPHKPAQKTCLRSPAAVGGPALRLGKNVLGWCRPTAQLGPRLALEATQPGSLASWIQVYLNSVVCTDVEA